MFFKRLKASALECSGLGVADSVFYAALAVGVTDARGIGYHPVVGKRAAVDRVQYRLIQIGADHAFFEVIEHHVLRHSAKVPKRLFV